MNLQKVIVSFVLMISIILFSCVDVNCNCDCKGLYAYPFDCNLNCDYLLNWCYNKPNQQLTFEITTTLLERWMGIGFSQIKKGPANNDLIIAWNDSKKKFIMSDVWIDNELQIHSDSKHSIFNISAIARKNLITYKFSRKLVTYDFEHDFDLDKCFYFFYPIKGGLLNSNKKPFKSMKNVPVVFSNLICLEKCSKENSSKKLNSSLSNKKIIASKASFFEQPKENLELTSNEPFNFTTISTTISTATDKITPSPVSYTTTIVSGKNSEVTSTDLFNFTSNPTISNLTAIKKNLESLSNDPFNFKFNTSKVNLTTIKESFVDHNSTILPEKGFESISNKLFNFKTNATTTSIPNTEITLSYSNHNATTVPEKNLEPVSSKPYASNTTKISSTTKKNILNSVGQTTTILRGISESTSTESFNFIPDTSKNNMTTFKKTSNFVHNSTRLPKKDLKIIIKEAFNFTSNITKISNTTADKTSGFVGHNITLVPEEDFKSTSIKPYNLTSNNTKHSMKTLGSVHRTIALKNFNRMVNLKEHNFTMEAASNDLNTIKVSFEKTTLVSNVFARVGNVSEKLDETFNVDNTWAGSDSTITSIKVTIFFFLFLSLILFLYFLFYYYHFWRSRKVINLKARVRNL